MTRIQKRRLISAGLIVITSILTIGSYVLIPLSHANEGKWIEVLYGFSAIYVILVFYTNRPEEVRLSKEECQLPIVPVVKIRNSFAWRLFILTTVWTILLCVPSWLFDLMRHSTFDTWYWLATFVSASLLYLIMLLYHRRNEYVIEGKTLIVREYKFSRPDTDLRIPIDAINGVSIKNNYSLVPRVVLEIHGLKRELRCISHPDELAVEILLRKQH